MSRKLILYIATSLDGYIAGLNDDLSFLSIVQKEGEDYGYEDFVKTIDTVILGRKTYDWVIKNAGELSYHNKQVYVITNHAMEGLKNTNSYNGDLRTLVENLKLQEGKDIFCDGGADIVNQLLQSNLIDEIVISIVPILLGNGKKLFQDGRPEQTLQLVNTNVFDTGLVQLTYRK